MASNANNIPEAWASLLGGYDASGWLSAFIESPKIAIADLMWDSFYFGPLNLTDKGQLLEGWLDILGNSESFAEQLDVELTTWVEDNWGQYERRADFLVSAWSCLCNVVEFSAKLPEDSQLKNCAMALRVRFAESQKFLGSFSTAPAADPLGLYLAVIAEFQGKDRSLATFWHRTVDLPDGIPFYHAPYAILGLRRLSAADPMENGTLRAEVVLGLLRLARAFDRLVRTRGLPEHIAKSTFHRIAVQTAAAYPNSPGWINHGLTEALELPERAQKWLVEAVIPLAEAIRRERDEKTHHLRGSSRSLKPQSDWVKRSRELAARLRSGDRKCISEARQLLNEERLYAEATGDTYHIVRTLCNLASRAFHMSPQLALSWAEEARKLEPYNDYTWNIVRTLLLRQGQITAALRIAWVAWKRFPEDSVASSGLAEVLKAARRYDEAEAIYRETIKRFPETGVPWAGLAEVLKAARRYDEAEAVYREAAELFPEDPIILNGLADTLRRMGRKDDAEAEYRRIIRSGYVDPATLVGLAYLILRQGEASRVEAIELANQALELEPRNIYALSLKRELMLKSGKTLDDLMNEWDKVVDSLVEVSPFPGREQSEWVGEHEAAPPIEVEQTEPFTEQIITPKVEHSVNKDPQISETKSIPARETENAQSSAQRTIISEKEPISRTTEVKSQPFIPSDSLAIAALVAEAYFHRTWAKKTDNKFAKVRLRKAANLLAQAERLSPQDPQVIAEKTALSIAEGDIMAAYQGLIAQLGSYPAAAPLLVLKARLDRERARKENRRLNDLTLDELCTFPQRLRELDPVLTPLFHYQRGLAALALLNGNKRKQTAAEAFSRFRRTLARRADAEHKEREGALNEHVRLVPRFHEWLQTQVNHRVFAGLSQSNDVEIRLNDIPLLEATWEQRRPAIEEIEDIFIDRLTYRMI